MTDDSGLVAETGQQTSKEQTTTNNEQRATNTALRFIAHFFSYIFHPLFIPIYVALFLIYLHPSYFAGFSSLEKSKALLLITINTVFFPGITVLLLKALNFISSIYLPTQRDRIIPYIASGTFYFWFFWVMKNQSVYPTIMVSFALGICISAFAGLMANIYFKISMHAIGAGAVLGLFLIIMKTNTMLMTWPLCLAFLLAGLVCTSRLLVSNHSNRELYSGLLLGILCQYAGALFT
jgi:hypothetical protein